MMKCHHSFFRTLLPPSVSPRPAILTVVFSVLFSVTLPCLAQNGNRLQAGEEPAPNEPQAKSQSASITVPAGTRFALVLTYPISTKTTHPGDDFHLQTTAPVTVGNQVAIPAGTFIQGTVDSLSRHGDRAELRLRSAQLIFPDGYVIALAEATNLVGSEGTAWVNPSGATKAGAILAPLVSGGIGAAIGNAAHTTQSSTLAGQTITSSTPKGLAIGSAVGLAAGAVVSFALVLHSRQFYVAEGAPMEMTLQQPLVLEQDEVAAAIEAAQEHPVAEQPIAPRPVPPPPPNTPTDHGTCWTPGTPGTPPTVIPGPPGPNGIPGPPTIIPGTPPTPGTPYPCP